MTVLLRVVETQPHLALLATEVIEQNGHSVVQHVPPFTCRLLAKQTV